MLVIIYSVLDVKKALNRITPCCPKHFQICASCFELFASGNNPILDNCHIIKKDNCAVTGYINVV